MFFFPQSMTESLHRGAHYLQAHYLQGAHYLQALRLVLRLHYWTARFGHSSCRVPLPWILWKRVLTCTSIDRYIMNPGSWVDGWTITEGVPAYVRTCPCLAPSSDRPPLYKVLKILEKIIAISNYLHHNDGKDMGTSTSSRCQLHIQWGPACTLSLLPMSPVHLKLLTKHLYRRVLPEKFKM